MATSINTMEVPVSTVQSATAASYTIPANRYGIVRAQVKNGGSLNIGGVTVLASNTWSVINSNASPTTISQSGAVGNGMLVPAGGSTWYLPSTNNTIANTGTAFSSAGATFSNSTAMTSDIQTFKVPTGTVIVGSGDARYHIELYRVPGSSS